MPQTEADEKQVVYQFRAPFSAWQDWKSTIPRQKSLETRLNELVRADTDGRVASHESPDAVKSLRAALRALENGDPDVATARDELEAALETIGDE